MRLTRKHSLLILLSVAGVVILLLVARRLNGPNDNAERRASPAAHQVASSAYADPAVCSSCHDAIARTYSLTGMARSFTKLGNGNTPLARGAGGSPADFKNSNRVYHKASDRHYTMVERNGRFYQRRHQVGFKGEEANALEREAHYVIGSGNHAQTFVHRAADERLFQLPVSWYSERGGYWAMSPGYDRPAHLDFRRVIDAGCMSCHNGYPRAPVTDDGSGPKFREPLAEGIDCQRCHGPGQAHVDAINRGDLDAATRAIVNPAKLDRERRLEVCMQCHLETTSSQLPFQIRRAEHPPFSYTPGKPLSDYFIHFDHAPGTARDDKFEIAGGAYRLRKSACFQQSQMTCGTCHNPHDIPRGAVATKHYVAVCQSCHPGVHRSGPPQVRGVQAGAACMDCHMPKRRAEDAVHVIMTDHYIQRHKPPRDLVAPRTEAHGLEHGDYRGEVVLYYPDALPAGPDNDLYLAVAQVQQGSNVSAGIRRLERAIGMHRPSRADFYYELARAYTTVRDYDASMRWSNEALRRDPAFVPALKELASAAIAKGDLPGAGAALERAIAVRPRDGPAHADLGNVYLQQGRLEDARRTLQRALALDPDMPLANNTMGLALLRLGEPDAAADRFREAIRAQPDLAEAHNSLGNLLAGRRAYAEAGFHFEKALASDPNYVDAHHSYGLVLALTGAHAKASAELQAAVRLAPGRLPAHLDLAEVLMALGRPREARTHFEAAALSPDQDVRRAALAGLRAAAR